MCPSFNAALAYQYTSKFVILDWLCDSRKSKQVLSCEKYMAIHNFARERGVLGGCFVFVCDGAIGNMAFEKVIHLIVAAGGKSVNALSIKDCDATKVIVLVSTSPEKVLPIRVEDAIRMGAERMTLNDFFDILMPKELIINGFTMDRTPDIPPQISVKAEHVPNIPPQKMAANKVKTSGPLRTPARRSMNDQTTTERTIRKQAIPQTSNPSKKASKTPSLAKIYEVEQAGTMLQGLSLKDKAITTGMKYGFDLSQVGRAPDGVNVASESAPAHKHVPSEENAHGDIELLFSTILVETPTRTLSNRNIGDPLREFLGGNGTLEVLRSTITNHVVVRYIDSLGETKFEAKVPRSDPHNSIFGNAGEQNVFAFDAFDYFFASGGTTVNGAKAAIRRYFFWFESIHQLSIALFFIFNKDMALVKKFFDKSNSSFYANVVTKPPHAVVRGEDDMDVDDNTPIRCDALHSDVAAEHEESSMEPSQIVGC